MVVHKLMFKKKKKKKKLPTIKNVTEALWPECVMNQGSAGK